MPTRTLLRVAVLVALGFTVVAVGMVIMSAGGRLTTGFESDELPDLADDEQIRSWVSLDQESYLVGDLVRYRVRLLWRDDQVQPDLQSFATSISFFPLDYRSHSTTERSQSGRVREYVADYVLQAINVDVPANIQLDTVTVYYLALDDATRTVRPLRANPPPAYFGEYYPADVSGIDLLAPKPPLDVATESRRYLMILCALALLLIGGGLLWTFGRRRGKAELTAAERLWREIDQRQRDRSDRKATELQYEKFMTQALEVRTGVSAAEFWTRTIATGDEWYHVLGSARRVLSEIYRPEGMSAASLGRIEELIRSLLRPMVDAARLERESMDGPWQRLRRHRPVLAAVGGMFFVALCALILASSPLSWVPHAVKQYNGASEQFAATGDVEQAVEEFAHITEIARDPHVQAAALYNLGTLLASPVRSRLSREQHSNFLQAIFLPAMSMTRFLHDVELETEAELLTMLSEITRQYVQAEQVLRAAARAAPNDAMTSRNLELLGKIRRAIGHSIQQLLSEAESQNGRGQILGQTVIDLKLLMETELPDEFSKTDEGKDDRSYFIMERF
ncbi:MAG: hypothetical protein HKN77_09110 [Woeseiaceae bacterium]|nr:hypothetical protein [Woeseiaceae bacterium]